MFLGGHVPVIIDFVPCRPQPLRRRPADRPRRRLRRALAALPCPDVPTVAEDRHEDMESAVF